MGKLTVFVCFEACVPVKKISVMCRQFPVLLSRANTHLSTEGSKVTFVIALCSLQTKWPPS